MIWLWVVWVSLVLSVLLNCHMVIMCTKMDCDAKMLQKRYDDTVDLLRKAREELLSNLSVLADMQKRVDWLSESIKNIKSSQWVPRER